MFILTAVAEHGLWNRHRSRGGGYGREPTHETPHPVRLPFPPAVIQCLLSRGVPSPPSPGTQISGPAAAAVSTLSCSLRAPLTPAPLPITQGATQVPCQGLSTCCSLCLECSSPETSYHFIPSLFKCHHLGENFPAHLFMTCHTMRCSLPIIHLSSYSLEHSPPPDGRVHLFVCLSIPISSLSLQAFRLFTEQLADRLLMELSHSAVLS